MNKAANDLRLVSVWHGPESVGALHFTLYNNGSTTLSGYEICMTGVLWLTKAGEARGGDIRAALSNFIRIRPDHPELAPGEVWSFSLSGLNTWPRHQGDGPMSAYVVLDEELGEERFLPVAVQPLARSRHAGELENDPPSPPEPPPLESTPPHMTIAVIPFPNAASVAIAPPPPDSPILSLGAGTPEDLAEIWRETTALARRVLPETYGVFADSGDKAQRRIRLRLVHDARLGPEGYKALFDGEDIHLEAESRTGLRYGLTTLAQMAIGARSAPQRFGFPVRGSLTDIPRFSWRGAMLDTARSFYPMQEIKAVADLLAWLKINLLHLHLNDDEAWRIAVDGYPEVAEHCARRGHGLTIPPLLGSAAAPYGGLYSPEEIKDLEAHAARLSLILVPEIDAPGHGYGLKQAIPALREAEDPGDYAAVQGFYGNALNPCLPETLKFLGAALDTTARLFAGPYVHIGGDEVGPETWAQSPLAQAAAAERGLARPSDLQGDVALFAEERLKRLGRKLVAWEDALSHADLDPENAVSIVWQHVERAQEAARRGYEVVLAPGNAYYLDMASSPDWRATGGNWAGVAPLRRTYDFEPALGWPAELSPKLRGVHACIWGEYMQDRRNFDALVFPRIFAFAERAWIDRTTKDYAGFLVRAAASAARINRSGTRA